MSQLPKKNSSGGSKPQSQASGGNKSTGGSTTGGRPPTKSGGTSGGSGNYGASSKASRPVQSQSQSRGSRPPAARQPVGKGGKPVSQQSGFRSNINQTLPPFSTRRYLAIWIPIMVVVLVVLLVLLFTLNNNNPSSNSAAQVTPTVPLGGAAGGATAAPQPATGGQSTAAPAAVPPVAVVTATQSLTGTGTYMVIDTAKGKIVAKLYTDPSAGVTKTVANFVSKAKAGYFNGLTFHRVEDWVIQGGDPKGNGTGGGTMPAEYNNIPFGVGALGVARGGDPAVNNDSQFFIVKDAAAAAGLVGQYTNFGQVVQGMDVVTKIAIGDKINSITIENK